MALRRGVTVMFAWSLVTLAHAAESGPDPQRGGDLYSGKVALHATTTDGAPVPTRLAACVQCHRPSGLGGFEGGSAVPPIAARYLFAPFDPDTSRFFRSEVRHRIRPAYDEVALGSMLRTGIAPDGHATRAPMPRYRIGERDVRDLAAYLRGLSMEPAPGIDASTVRIATITTPGIDPARAAAMLAVLRTFETGRNRQTRQEFQRSAQSRRSHEMAMSRKFRVWKLVHWALDGDPQTWAAQLERYQAEAPVFGVMSGMGTGDWSAVEAFCERRRLPCILPQIDQVPIEADASSRFFSLYFHAGLEHDLGLAIDALQRAGVRRVELWMNDANVRPKERVAIQVQNAGLTLVDEARGPSEAVLSTLAPDEHLARWRARRSVPDAVAWLPGARWQPAQQWLDGTQGAATAVLVTPLRPSDEAAASMRRARDWLRSNGLLTLPDDVATTTLYAATVFGEAFAHLDFDFTREYALELIEHRLESMPPMSPYPRLAIGPDQRVASKGSYVGTVRTGRVDWQWKTSATP